MSTLIVPQMAPVQPVSGLHGCGASKRVEALTKAAVISAEAARCPRRFVMSELILIADVKTLTASDAREDVFALIDDLPVEVAFT